VTGYGLLGGTFDPIHMGHLDVAEAACRALGLPQVLLLPARVPPHRAAPRASAADRFAMTALAIQDHASMRMSDVDMEADGPCYTSASLDRLAARGVTGPLFFITGADAFREIATWKHYPEILDRCHFVAVSRRGCPAASLRDLLPTLRERMIETPCEIPARPSIFLVEAPTAPVSSTDVRRLIAEGAPITGLVPDPVAAYIARHGLYAAGGAEGIA